MTVKKVEYIFLRVPMALKKEVEKAAHSQNLSVNQWGLLALSDAVTWARMDKAPKYTTRKLKKPAKCKPFKVLASRCGTC